MKKRFLALLLALTLVFSLMPAALAVGPDVPTDATAQSGVTAPTEPSSVYTVTFRLHTDTDDWIQPTTVANLPEGATVFDVFRQMLGEDSVIELTEPRCGSEDFSNYQRPGVQTGYFWLGGAYPGEAHPSTNHQPRYNWDERTMRTGVQAACAAVCSYLIAD